jgi:hypothetical protein
MAVTGLPDVRSVYLQSGKFREHIRSAYSFRLRWEAAHYVLIFLSKNTLKLSARE